jgi:RimJ/RimL family protein N-acetyltransferase
MAAGPDRARADNLDGWCATSGCNSVALMSNGSLPVLSGERVILRAPREEDFEARLSLGTNAEIIRMHGGQSDVRPMTEEAAKHRVRRLLHHDHAWIIEVGTLIGEIRLDRVDLRDRRASLAIGIEDVTQLGKGLGSQAIDLALGYAFNVLKLHRVSARVV